MHEKTKGQPFGIENATEVLGNDFFLKLKEIECSVMLDHAIFGYFERCRLMNEVLSEKLFFEVLQEKEYVSLSAETKTKISK